MKKQKKITILIVLFIIIFNIFFNTIVNAVSSDLLISLGTGQYAIEVTKTTTVDDIIKILGEPKLVTPSAFGGSAYTFYTDDNYNNYLYIETLSDGQIFSYGSIDKTFKTQTYSYGDNYPYSDNMALHGYMITNSEGMITGGIFYNKNALLGGRYKEIMNFYQTNYLSDETNYTIGLSKQGILMYNALSVQLENKDTTPIVFDEEVFYINKQFQEFGSDISEYLRQMNLFASCVKSVGVKSSVEIADTYYMINPLMFGGMAYNNKYLVFENKNIAVFSYDKDTKILRAITISADAFDRNKIIDYTAEEKEKLKAGREEYKQAVENLQKEDEVYDINPVIETPSGLVAGQLKESKQEGILQYINAIRVAGGLPKFETNDRINEVAQYKSTLVSYRKVKLGLDIAHYFDKPEGVLDSFYDTAMGRKDGVYDVGGYAENIATTNENIRWQEMVSAIQLLIDDSTNDSGWDTFGHRLALLSSKHKYIGFGISPYVAVNEFNSSNTTYTDCAEAWPSKGVTFLETLLATKFAWTVKFVDKYTVQKDKTTATIKCLNTGETWDFTEEEMSNNKKFVITTDSLSAINNKVIMYDSSIIPQAGYVYEVTINGLKDNITGQDADYTYRAVFDYADTNNYVDTIKDIKIEEPQDMQKNGETYVTEVGKEIKLNAIIDDASVVDKKITWSSSNEDIIEVKQNGQLVIKKETSTPVTITVSSDANGLSDSMQIIVNEKPKLLKGDVNRDGKVALYDAFRILRQAIIGGDLLDDELYIMDYNDDGKVALYDAFRFLRQAILED